MKLGLKIGLLLILFSSFLEAQYSNKIHFKTISVQDGLSFPFIKCLLQDSKGFLWVGTTVGLNKYDSQKFKRYYANPEEEGALSSDYITCLYQDQQQNIWVGTQKGLNIYDRQVSIFRQPQEAFLKTKMIRAITGDKSGNNWVLTRKYLFLLDNDQALIKKFHISDLKDQADITDFSTAKVDASGNLWINTNKGVRLFDPAAQQLTNPLNDQEDYLSTILDLFTVIYFDKKNRIWVCSRGNGIKYYDPASKNWKRVQNLSSQFINGVIEDINGKFWICSGRNGLNIYDPETEKVEILRYADKPESNFVSNSLSCAYADNSGGIWIGTFNTGLQYYFQHQLQFNLFYSEGQISGINSNYITSFAIDTFNNIWIGAGEEGLLHFDRKTSKFRNIKPFNTDPEKLGELKENFYIFDLLLTEDQDHLLASTLTGLYDYHLSKNEWRYFHKTIEDKEAQSSGFFVSMIQDGDKVYLATYEGLSVYDLRQQRIQNIPPPGTSLYIATLAQNGNTVFLGSRFKGLWRYSKEDGQIRKVVPKHAHIRIPELISDLYLDQQERLVVISGSEGMFRYDLNFSKMEQLQSKVKNKKLAMMTVCEDPDRGYWVGSNQGLIRINEQLEIEKIFDQKEGFEASYFTANSISRSPSNEILVGGNTGFYAFNPSSFYTPSNITSNIHLTDFLILNKSVIESEVGGFKIEGDLEVNSTIRLPKYQNLLTFEYAALDFHNPSRIEYAFKLEPYEENWNEVGNRHFATYRDLPAGAYTFNVKYQIDNEDYSENIASLKVIIPPQPWRTWWAYLCYAAVLFIIFRQFYLYRRNRRLLRQEIAMQKFQSEKMEELYQFKIDFFTQVTHELRTPLTLIIGPLEELIQRNKTLSNSNLLKLIHRNTQKLLQRVNQILDFRKLEHSNMKVFAKKGNIVAFTEEIFYSFLHLTKDKGVELHFETNMEKSPFVLFDKDIMEKILVNLISNAVKFTNQGSISFNIYEQEDHASQYFIKITDTGRGIKAENLPKIFESFFQEKRGNNTVGSGIGLKMVKELTSLHHGTINVTSEVDQGTTFSLSFPKADLDLMAEESLKPSITQEMNQSHVTETAGAGQGLASAKILIVDDEPDVLTFLKEIFSQQHQIFAVGSAQKAIDIAKSEMPDLIISDVMMPEMDGFELCAYTKSEFLLSHIPVILLTALNTTEHEIEGLKTGADAYISKPFPPKLLKATVQNLLSSRQKLKQAFLNSAINDAKDLTQNNSDQQFIDQVIAFIDKRIDQANLEISEISNELGMSSSTFYRKLKSLTDLSGNEFIKTVRLKRSLEYLKNTDMNISEIAYRVGFSDPKYFSTCFRKFFHITPTEFITQNRN